MIGVFWGHWIFGGKLSILGVAGMIGLIGIVLNDALVWVDCYNRQRESGLDVRAASMATIKRRFRPIALTTLTTVLALLPSAVSGVGVATDIARITIYGLLSSSVLLLIFFPVIMLAYDKVATATSKQIITMAKRRLTGAVGSWIH